MKTSLSVTLFKVLRQNTGLLFFLALMFAFRSSIADWNEVPTGSMQPTIVEGDRILVNKMAYDIRVPFTHVSMHKIADPQVGDIIIFDSAVSNKRLVKRVVGVPGDTVELRENTLYINGQPLRYKDLSTNAWSMDKVEYLDNTEHFVRLSKNGSSLSNFPPTNVPKNQYLALGDNRDNSADSRVIGFVPRREIVGRTRSVVLSLDYENYYMPRPERFLRQL